MGTGAKIVRYEIRIAPDDPVWVYLVPADADPRAVNRGYSPKATVNGFWTIEVRAIDTNGCTGVGRSPYKVRVFQ